MHIPANISRTLGAIGMTLQKHAPTILTVTGVVAGVAATGFAIHSTLHCTEILEEQKSLLKDVERSRYIADNDPDFEGAYSEEQERMDRKIIAIRTVAKFGKLYWPTIALTTASVTCILVGHNMMSNRVAAVTAAFTAISGKFDDYRKMVVEKYGIEADSDCYKGITETPVLDEDGKESDEVERTQKKKDGPDTDLARFFDETSPFWDAYNPGQNVANLRAVNKHLQDMLAIRGHVLVNDVYDELGIQRTPAGAVMGWIYDKDHQDTVIDLGIYKDTDDPWDFTIDEPWDGTNGIMLNIDGAAIMYDKI